VECDLCVHQYARHAKKTVLVSTSIADDLLINPGWGVGVRSRKPCTLFVLTFISTLPLVALAYPHNVTTMMDS
jgi:hypothetical protein